MSDSGKFGRLFKRKNKDEAGNKDAENDKMVATSKDDGDEGFNPPDGGWGWIVCLTSLWANGTVFGIINTFGLVYVPMREHYSKNDPEVSLKTAFVGSTCTGVTFLMCTVSSILSDRIGIRPTAFTGAVLATIGLIGTAFIEKLELLYLTYGLILGIGSSMVYSPSLVILGHYFKKHLGLVNGIVAFGSSVFTIVLTRILPYLLKVIEIKYCFIFLASLHFVCILFTLTWKPLFIKEDHLAQLTLSTESVYQHCNDCCSWTRKFLNVRIWKSRAYVTWIVSLCIAFFGYFVPFFHLPQYIQDNFPGEDGSWPILCLSITSGVSRIICGKLADIECISRIKMQQCAFVVLGISTLCIPFTTTFGGLIGISLVMGLCDGVVVCLLGPIAFDIVGPSEASQAIGFLLGIFSIPFTFGPPIAGWMYDTMGNYRVAFHVAGAPPILGAVLMFLIPKVQQSFPAVSEAMEFASMSVVDVYNEVKVPSERPAHKVKNGAPSGPATEIQILTSQELIYHAKTEDQSDIELSPMLEKDVNNHHHVSFSTENLHPSNKQDRNTVSSDINENIGDADLNGREGDMNGDFVNDTNEQFEADDEASHADFESSAESNAQDPESSLLQEVGKLLDARISYNDDEKTSL